MLSSKELLDKFSLYVESSQKLQYPSWATFMLPTVKFSLAVGVFLKYAGFKSLLWAKLNDCSG